MTNEFEIKKKFQKINYFNNLIFINYFVNDVENISSVQTINIESTNYHITETFTSVKSLSKAKTNQILLIFIAMVGCIDIILLSAYVIICMHDQRRRQKETKFSSPGQQSYGRSTAYENIENVSFFSAR